MNTFAGSSLDYSSTPKNNFQHRTKLVDFQPMGNFNGAIGSSDIVRFNVKGEPNTFWDPYSAFIEIAVDVSTNDLLNDDGTYTNKIIQLDSSAQSFFSSLIITDNGEELERIMQYDTLACLLKDVACDVGDRYMKDYEGLGGAYMPSMMNTVTSAGCRPNMNDGATKAIKTWVPLFDQNSFIDLNNNPWIQSQVLNTYYTSNHMINMSQSGFQPIYNRAATTWSNGNNNLEWRNNFPNDANLVAAGAIDPQICGSSCPYPPAFCANGFEPCMSKTLNQRYMYNGVVKTDRIQQMVFQVPLLSAFFGHLLPPNCYKLIPLRYFRDLVMEFQLNPYALFVSWFTSNQQARGYTIKSLKLKSELVIINDPLLLAKVDLEYEKGIKISSQAWTMGPLCPVVNGQIPPTLQINLGFESLRDIMFCFIPNDYMANAGCRKQYRLSMNVTSMQLKIGTDHFPQQPIKGNGGTNIGLENNNEFIKHLWKSFGKHCQPQDSCINPHNFAVNCRAMDPYNTNNDLFITTNSQAGFFEENRVIGKAVYALNVDALNYENKMLSGLNTAYARPFDLMLSYESAKLFPRAVTMFTFFRHDSALSISPAGVKVYGRN